MKYTCSCGHVTDDILLNPGPCAKCGKPISPPGTAVTKSTPQNSPGASARQPAADLTLIYDEASASGAHMAASSARHAAVAGSGTQPRNIDGHEIISVLGVGGMGSVYLAYEPLLDREIALKLLQRSPDEAARARAAARFLSEANLTGRLGHAGIIPIHKIGFDPLHGYYYTMRYVKGRTLSEIIARLVEKDAITLEHFTLNRRLTLFLRVLEAIAFAHKHHVVHRDIKPSNIIVADFGEVLVLDWGLAKATKDVEPAQGIDPEAAARLHEIRTRRGQVTSHFLGKDKKSLTGTQLVRLKAIVPASERQLTQAEQILGTPGYLSPEQGDGQHDVSPASDVYSLGITLYELLTYRLPTTATEPMELVTETVLGKLIPISDRPEAIAIPKALCEIVTKAISLHPDDRYHSAGEMAEELALYLEGRAAWKPVAEDACNTESTDLWTVLNGELRRSTEGMVLPQGTHLRTARVALGDFRGSVEFWAEGGNAPWSFSVGISEVQPNGHVERRYEIRVGVEDRPYVELLRNGRRMQRRFDVRLQGGQRYILKVELEEGQLRMWIDERKYIEYKEVFPQTGGAVEILASSGQIHVQRFSMVSRGAPLHLSFMVLPDRLYRTGRFFEARELYRQLAESHPDREEGLIATYKAGLCSTALRDTQAAFGEFTRLEGTMYDHCCALGLAQIGMLDGNIDWAWEALKNGIRRHSAAVIRSEMWFSLLGLIEHLDASRHAEKIDRYKELLRELNPEPAEAGQIAFDLLDLVQETKGFDGLRAEALELISTFPDSAYLVTESLLSLCRAGLDDAALTPVAAALDKVMNQRCPDFMMARFHLLRAEIALADGLTDEAHRHCRDALTFGGPASAEGLWAKGWQILIRHLSGNSLATLTEVHEVQVRFRRYKLSQLAYFRLLEGLGYLGKHQPSNALAAYRSAVEYDCIWGWAATHYIAKTEPKVLGGMAGRCGANQVVEALFLVGEAHMLAGNLELALQHYQYLLEPARPRAMIARFVKLRMEELAKKTVRQ